jgi:hypothetical protein
LLLLQNQQLLETAPKPLVNNVIRNIASLDQTLAVFNPEFKSEHGIRKNIIGSIVKINQVSTL